MKVHMYDWFGNTKGLPAWFKDQQDTDVTWEQIKELYDAGVNIMMKHRTSNIGECTMLLAVSNGGFGQRG